MISYLEKTGLNFVAGQTLKAADLKKINDTVNALVDVVNVMLKETVDVNLENNDATTSYTLDTAIALVGNIRRAYGQKIRFKGGDGRYLEYSYAGPSLNDADWNDTSNWASSVILIDGGVY